MVDKFDTTIISLKKTDRLQHIEFFSTYEIPLRYSGIAGSGWNGVQDFGWSDPNSKLLSKKNEQFEDAIVKDGFFVDSSHAQLS